jgi:hypothetical protein
MVSQMQEKVNEVVRTSDPIMATVVAVLLAIAGVLVIIYPMLIGWIVGLLLIVAGVALLASIYGGAGRN